MSNSPCVEGGTVERALWRISTSGVETRDWSGPSDGVRREPPAHPVLYLVDPDVDPPPCGGLEDWVRHPLDLDDLLSRVDRLVIRGREFGAPYTRVDEDGVLRVGGSLTVLSASEARLMRTLVEAMGHVVSREDLETAVWPDGLPPDSRALDNRVKTLRKRLAGLPLRIHTIRGRGLLLERVSAS